MLGAVIGAVVGAVGAIAATAASVVQTLTVVGLAVEGLKTLGSVIIGILKALGIVKQERTVDELGDKAIQAEEADIRPENYDTYEEYVRAVEAYETDPEKSKQISEEDKVKKGVELITGIAVERYKDFPVQEYLELVGKNPAYFTEARMKEFNKMLEGDRPTLTNIVNYLRGTEHNSDKIQSAMNVQLDIERKLDPDISESDALDNIVSARL